MSLTRRALLALVGSLPFAKGLVGAKPAHAAQPIRFIADPHCASNRLYFVNRDSAWVVNTLATDSMNPQRPA